MILIHKYYMIDVTELERQLQFARDQQEQQEKTSAERFRVYEDQNRQLRIKIGDLQQRLDDIDRISSSGEGGGGGSNNSTITRAPGPVASTMRQHRSSNASRSSSHLNMQPPLSPRVLAYSEEIHLEYIKTILFKFISPKGTHSERSALIPVLARLLSMDPDEQKQFEAFAASAFSSYSAGSSILRFLPI
jgi:hypothetical protein